jgi:hypothetical protein
MVLAVEAVLIGGHLLALLRETSRGTRSYAVELLVHEVHFCSSPTVMASAVGWVKPIAAQPWPTT